MNLYNLHSKPESLVHFEISAEINPDFFWKKYKDNKEELKKREKYIAKDAVSAYSYAREVLKGPFPTGEEAISKDTDFAYEYARDILKKDFYLNGKLIAKKNNEPI